MALDTRSADTASAMTMNGTTTGKVDTKTGMNAPKPPSPGIPGTRRGIRTPDRLGVSEMLYR